MHIPKSEKSNYEMQARIFRPPMCLTVLKLILFQFIQLQIQLQLKKAVRSSIIQFWRLDSYIMKED